MNDLIYSEHRHINHNKVIAQNEICGEIVLLSVNGEYAKIEYFNNMGFLLNGVMAMRPWSCLDEYQIVNPFEEVEK